jgi:hypothetical protein
MSQKPSLAMTAAGLRRVTLSGYVVPNKSGTKTAASKSIGTKPAAPKAGAPKKPKKA